MTKRILVAAGLVAAIAGSTAIGLAQGPGPGRPDGPGMHGPQRGPRMGPRFDFGVRGLKLTDAQEEQMRAIRESHRAEFESVGKALGEAHRAFAEATRGAAIDEAALRSRSTALANAMVDEALLQAKVRAEVHALLTPEQQQQLAERAANLEKRNQERQQRQRRPQ